MLALYAVTAINKKKNLSKKKKKTKKTNTSRQNSNQQLFKMSVKCEQGLTEFPSCSCCVICVFILSFHNVLNQSKQEALSEFQVTVFASKAIFKKSTLIC